MFLLTKDAVGDTSHARPGIACESLTTTVERATHAAAVVTNITHHQQENQHPDATYSEFLVITEEEDPLVKEAPTILGVRKPSWTQWKP